jgi:hypothetical protein
MPAVSDELPSEKKNLVARWIARGAVGTTRDDGGNGTDAGNAGP